MDRLESLAQEQRLVTATPKHSILFSGAIFLRHPLSLSYLSAMNACIRAGSFCLCGEKDFMKDAEFIGIKRGGGQKKRQSKPTYFGFR